MPFKSEKQRRYLHANHPGIAKRWEQEYSGGGIARMGYAYGDQVDDMMTERTPLGNLMVENTNIERPTSGYENEQRRKEKDDAFEQLRQESPELFAFNPGSMFGTDAKYVDDTNQGGIVDVDQVRELIENSRNQGIETTNINGLPETYNPYKNYGQFFRNQPVDESTPWYRESTGADMIKNPDFPGSKENLGGILEYAKGKGIQGKDLLMAGLGKAINFPIGLAGKFVDMLGGAPDNPYQKFQKDMFAEAGYSGDQGKDPWGQNVRSFTDTYDVTDQWDKFSGSVLGQKYGLEALGADGLTEEELANLEEKGLKGYQLNRARQLSKFNQKAQAYKKQKAVEKKAAQDHQQREAKEAARQKELDKRQATANAQAARGQTTSGGRGNYQSSRDHSGRGGYGGSGAESRGNRSSDLGFSDIRLKDNIEFIGQSPSNINIYKFNYLNDPTIYQGVMAQDVPWASAKSDNGYLMVDYNKVDVEFKKWHKK
jgi:hypothetical protein|tara:strand:- start:4046 stop:5500 length:1455 start_codon:yes stop_codon:yes gene_type:complete